MQHLTVQNVEFSVWGSSMVHLMAGTELHLVSD